MITVQEGCDKFCSFCVVPYTRGRKNSQDQLKIFMLKLIILCQKGSVEVTLLGQNVSSYKSLFMNGKEKKIQLADLCKIISNT